MGHGQGHDDQGKTHIAILASESGPDTPSETDEPMDTLPDHAVRQPQPLPRRRRRLTLLAAGAACLLALTLVLTLADAGRTSAGHAPATPTATVRPTPTVTPIPSPTPMLGFQVYVDRADGFLIQYPTTWVYSLVSPGVQFDDDANNIAYEVQVLVPGDATSVGPSTTPDDASVWVTYEMSTLSKQFQGSFQQVPGPAPAATIGKQLWQSGVALITVGQTRIRVQVYATVYLGKPYLINLLAVDDRFDAGTIQFFTPMLQSFEFLPSTS
jgi:hypothetical protein